MVRTFAAITLILLATACGRDSAAPASGGGEDSVTSISTQNAGDDRLAKALFGAVAAPSSQPSEPLGSYARGCQAGAVQLPETGPTWQAMRLSRNRNWGQPVLIDYLADLSAFAATQPGWAGLYIGDMSQPRGGPMLTGHASHQIGLDADIWMLPPDRLNLTETERENLSSIRTDRADGAYVNSDWTPQHMAILRAAASDPARQPHLRVRRRQGRDVRQRHGRPVLAAQDPALVGAQLPFPRPAELPARRGGLRGAGTDPRGRRL